ncbi:MAG: DoxX family protein [[Pasteurella] mairii]|uniref:DoxX n=1 Tax=[Pasteurella] mairii TaxID=757 RepID=A0A379B482_9PAST|nr:DoxX family protein [[Pasteurella] mairii]SUB33058.1 DoxX [[Pasteurella] mairii]
MNILENLKPYILGLLRILAGYLYFLHGTAKLFEFPVSMTSGNGAVALFSLMGVAAILELVGGLLLLLGLFTRITSFLLSGQMAVAYLIAHASAATFLFPPANKGEIAVLYALLFFYFVFSGPGAFALDNRKKAST